MGLNSWVKFNGTVYSRSSKRDSGPPGEAEILALNPERRSRILRETGWKDLAVGTLNLSVSENDVHQLLTLEPLFVEHAPTYPEKYDHIPKKRVGYMYYRARLGKRRRRTHVLLRRAINPVKQCIEVLAPMNLREHLNLSDGDTLSVKAVSHVDNRGSVFTDARGRDANVGDRFHGAACFLIMNGPSFKQIDRGPLKFVYTMCVNNGPKALSGKLRPNLFTCVDSPDKFLYTTWCDPTIMKVVPECQRHKPLWNSDTNDALGMTVSDCPNVIYYKRNNRFRPDKFLNEDSVNWGNSSKFKDENGVKGKRSCMLAAIGILYRLGFRRIYLLGCDFKMDANAHYSFPQNRKGSAIRGNNSTYKQLDWRFNRMREHFANNGLQVFNCNPDSGLTAFPFISYDEALADALRHVPNWRDYVHGKLENTLGLYESKWYVCGKCSKNQRHSKEDIQAGKSVCECGFALTEDNRRKYLKDRAQGAIES